MKTKILITIIIIATFFIGRATKKTINYLGIETNYVTTCTRYSLDKLICGDAKEYQLLK